MKKGSVFIKRVIFYSNAVKYRVTLTVFNQSDESIGFIGAGSVAGIGNGDIGLGHDSLYEVLYTVVNGGTYIVHVFCRRHSVDI